MQATCLNCYTETVKNGYKTAESWRRTQRSNWQDSNLLRPVLNVKHISLNMGPVPEPAAPQAGPCSNFMELSIETTKEPAMSLGFPNPSHLGLWGSGCAPHSRVQACGTERSRGSRSQEKTERNLHLLWAYDTRTNDSSLYLWASKCTWEYFNVCFCNVNQS